jgi:hypothetical protein
VDADQFILDAIERGQSSGLAQLNADERFVFLISEAEVLCDKDGIDTLLDTYPTTVIEECAAAFLEIGASEVAAAMRKVAQQPPARNEADLDRANSLITQRAGYGYDAIRATIEPRLNSRVKY